MVSVVGNTARNLAVAIAQQVGPYQLFPILTTSASTTTVIAATMADSEAPTSRYGGYYLYSHGPSVLGEQNRVTRAGFVGASGTFMVAKQFSANPASGTQMSLLGTIPWTDQDGLTGLVTCINCAAQRLWIRYRYPFTATNGTMVYDLGALWWATRRRFIRLLDPDYASNGHNAPSSTSWNIVQNADVWSLELSAPFASGQVFYLEVEMPLNARIYSATTGLWTMTASPAAGLSADGDAYLGDWNTVYQCGLYDVMKQLAVQAGGNRKAYWESEAQKQGAVVSAIKSYMMSDDGESLSEGPNQSASAGVGGYGDRGFFTGGRR